MWFQFKSYFKFLASASNQHGVHSPFVYNLVTQCFYDTKDKPEYFNITTYRTRLFKTEGEVTLKEDDQIRKVKISTLAKKNKFSNKKSKLLFRLSEYLSVQSVLEFGSSLHLVTASLAANLKTVIQVIEDDHEANRISFQLLKEANFENLPDTISKLSELPTPHQQQVDLVYVNKLCSKNDFNTYFSTLLKLKHNDSVFVFNNIYHSKENLSMWEEIKNHPEVRVTIDTFLLGLVFFRTEQAKEHFKIRL
ncbi:class I SAM-dependent methyltransferase [Mesonia aestuariivivens]|uniref:Class I SAM-dependent methyltransferase n=1 Tax=Mesonia aestuariivivens TaxID=2796128 RepID=A0ABS6W1Z3_9FLAO|nr:class I SAM-dependent methyltransferase [Mesonia aestuariivivens]MBW2961839.1 class I SAM-dependent methyltransferase [Mesonia aestuariivivens]